MVKHSGALAIRRNGPRQLGTAREIAARTGWQPIETAPKPHKRVLLFCQYEAFDDDDVEIGNWSSHRLQWETDSGRPIEEDGYSATHWQPLPAPPETP